MRGISCAASQIALAIVGIAAPVQAATSTIMGNCGTPGCGGEVYNANGSLSVPIANCWPANGGSYQNGDNLSCASNGWGPNKNSMWSLHPGAWSTNLDPFYDVDAIGVRANCLLQVSDQNGGSSAWDRRGKSSLWIKFSDPTTYTVTRYVCF